MPSSRKNDDHYALLEGNSSGNARSKAHRTESSRNAKQQALADFASYINTIVLEAVQKSIQSASVHAAQRKRLLAMLIPAMAGSGNTEGIMASYPGFDGDEVKEATMVALRDVVLNRLPIPTAADSLKRFTLFLSDLCKNYGRETKNLLGEYLDDVPATIIESLVSYHNAKDKQVRLMVCTLIQALLVTLAETVPREALYAALTNALKDRCYDKCPMVREKAISALKAFHLGEKEDDVTQCAISLLCEDVNPKVREASILSVPKYRSVHLRHIIRMTKDVHSSVRRACWESLAAYDVKHQLLGYCVQLGIDLFDVAAGGLKDTSEPVRDACRNTIAIAWLQRGFGNDLSAMVDSFFGVPTTIATPSATLVIRYLMTTLKQQWKPISLVINPLTPANAILWKCSVMHFLDASDEQDRNQQQLHMTPGAGSAMMMTPATGRGMIAGNTHDSMMGGASASGNPYTDNPALSPEDDACGLPLLSKFRIILTSVVNQYAGKPPAAQNDATRASGVMASTIQPEDVKVPPSEDNSQITFVVDLLLSVFDIYADLGMLGHADDNGRAQLLRPLGFLLKVVTIDKPICFVDASVKAIKNISERHEGEGKTSIESALRMLFSLLSIPKKNKASYEDVEGYSRADFERRRRIDVLEHQRLQDGEDMMEGSEEEQLVDDVSTDDAVMLRMCRIAHAYLSCVLRGTDIPPFVSHIIQFGRAQRNIEARALSIQCLTLQCLINPQTVTTFLPIFMSQSSDSTSHEVAVAAASGLFDMMSEYGPKFFDNNGGSGSSQQANNNANHTDADGQATSMMSPRNTVRMDAEQQRLEIERLAAEDDSYKPGSQVIVKQMFSFLRSENAQLRHLAMFGFCKLLAANRLVQEACVPVIARLLHYYVTFEAANVDDKEQLQMHRLVEDFFRSFAFSHPRRQVQVLEAGLLALRLVLNEHIATNGTNANDVPKTATKLLKRTINLTDAINVQQVRDVDPDLSAQVAHQTALEASRISGVETSLEDSVLSRSAAGNNRSGGGASRSVTIRLWRELGRCSLHERLALELLADAAQFRDNDPIVRLLLSELQLVRLYKRDVNLFEVIKQHAEECKKAINEGPSNNREELCAIIDQFVVGAEKIKAPSLDDSMFTADMSTSGAGGRGGFAFPGSTTNDGADGLSLAARGLRRKSLADAVNKMIMPIRDIPAQQLAALAAMPTATHQQYQQAMVVPSWLAAGDVHHSSSSSTTTSNARSSTAAASKSASRATGGSGSMSQAQPQVKEEFADLVKSVVVKRRRK